MSIGYYNLCVCLSVSGCARVSVFFLQSNMALGPKQYGTLTAVAVRKA